MNFTQFIPQVYYDFIGRIVAGLALICTCCVLWGDKYKLFINNYSEIGELSFSKSILFYIFISYIASTIIEGFFNFIKVFTIEETKDFFKLKLIKARKALNNKFEKPKELGGCFFPEFKEDVINNSSMSFEDKRLIINKINKKIPTTNHKKKDKDDGFPSSDLLYDAIRLINPNIGSNIVKLKAEARLYRTLTIGWIIILWILLIDLLFFFIFIDDWANLHRILTPTAYIKLSAIPILSLSIVSMIILKQKRERYQVWALRNYWLLLVDPKLKYSNEKESKE